MKFKIGQKIVCVNNSDLKFANPLKEKKIYTVRGCSCTCSVGGGVLLEEVHNSTFLCKCSYCSAVDYKEIGYKADRFRPVEYSDVSRELVKEMIEEGLDIMKEELQLA